MEQKREASSAAAAEKKLLVGLQLQNDRAPCPERSCCQFTVWTRCKYSLNDSQGEVGGVPGQAQVHADTG